MNLADQMALGAGVVAGIPDQQPSANLADRMQNAAPDDLGDRMARAVNPVPEQPVPPSKGWNMGQKSGVGPGIGEGILALGSGTVGALAAGGMGWLERASGKSWDEIARDQQALQEKVQFQPTTTIGKGIAQAGGWVGKQLDDLGAWAAGHAGDLAQAAGADPDTVAAIKTGTHAATMALAPRAVGPALSAPGAIVRATKAVAGGAGDVVSGVLGKGEPAPTFEPEGASAAPTGASVGASAATAAGRMSTATPEMADSIATQIADAQARYGAAWKEHLDPNALDRHLEADSLGAATGAAPGRLSPGQASQDPALLSNEVNRRTVPGAAQFYQWQNRNLADHLQGLRDQTAPDVNTVTPTEHGQVLIDAYKGKYAPRAADIDSDWNAIRVSSGDAPIFDAGRMVQDAQAALKAKLLSSIDPGGQLAELTDAARRGGLTADGYNAFRQNLGKIAMRGGTEGDAASAVINATNASELLPQAAQFRGMVNDALAKGRALHTDLEADPAYDAAVNGTVSANDFVNKFLVRGKVENVAQMAKNLGDNDVASQTMRAAVIDNLRRTAGLDDQYQGDFASKSFNKQLADVRQRTGPIFQGGEVPTLQALGNYARNVKEAPAGNYINRSNTAVAAPGIMSRAAGLAGAGAEGLGNAALPGLHLGTIIGSGFRARSARVAAAQQELENAQYLQELTRPGGGVIR